jgi:hypothetical protein
MCDRLIRGKEGPSGARRKRMRQLVTRYETDEGHGWYVGSDAEIVLAPGEPEVWPGMFEAYVRLRGEDFPGLSFRSAEEEAEFGRDVRGRVGRDEGRTGAATTGSAEAP